MIGVTACQNPESGDGPDVSKRYKGMGNSTEMPEGEPYQLPDGIVAGEALPFVEADTFRCADLYPEDILGLSEGRVDLCIEFQNKKAFPIEVTLPPGLIVVSKNLKVQNGMLLERVTFEVPAQTRMFKPIGFACMNGNRSSAPYGDGYTIGPVTNVPPVLELLAFIADKDLHADTYLSGSVGGAIRNLGHDGKISNFNRSQLEKLPLKQSLR
ncbi:hypothetical protein GCM10023091_29560 [Ravibacter arvi]|uniref:Lipoprotein n=2 Tax=Ravibacter arvi TaxID=2051041 RepID=A0ABP8M241_9BACT